MMEEANLEKTMTESPATVHSNSDSPRPIIGDPSESNKRVTSDSFETMAQDEHISLLPNHIDGSSSEKKSEIGSTTESTEVLPVEVGEIVTSLSEGSNVENSESTCVESGTPVISSMDKSYEITQVDGSLLEAREDGERVSSDPDELTVDESKDSNGLESYVPGIIESARTNDGIISMTHDLSNVKTEDANLLENSSSNKTDLSQAVSILSSQQEVQEGKSQPTSHLFIRQQKPSNVLTGKPQAPSNSNMKVKQAKVYSGLVDTAAPFESVKEAVSKFGGIVDWKAHKVQTMKRRELVKIELQKAQEEIPVYKKQMEDAEDAKTKAIKELQDTKRLIEELKLDLEKVQTEEAQAKQDSELAQLRVKEMEQGIAGEASVAIKAQVDVAKRRHAAAVTELEAVRAEMENLQEQHAILIIERDNAIKRAEEATAAATNIEKTVEDLTLELITARESLEAAHAAHMEAEEHRIGAALARDQDSLTWEKELKHAEEEVKQLNEKLSSMKDLQSKLDTASALLLNLKAELAAYMEAKLNEESEGIMEGKAKSELKDGVETHADVQATVTSVKKEIEEVKINIEKAKAEVDILKVAAVSLKSELDKEKAALASMQQREGMASIAVSSLEAEIKRTGVEIEAIQAKEKEANEKMLELPKAIQQAAREAEEAKSASQSAQEELKKEKEVEEQVLASVSTLQSRLNAALKEIEAAKVSEKLALAAVKALQESEQAVAVGHDDDTTNWVTLALDEYYALSKRAHDAEMEANERMDAALSQIELAKISESESLQELEDAQQKLAEKKEALRVATEKAEVANQGKLSVEQELRKWRAENMQRRKVNEASQGAVVNHPSGAPQRSLEEARSFLGGGEAMSPAQPPPGMRVNTPGNDGEVKVKKKKASLLPKIVMLLGRKTKDHSK